MDETNATGPDRTTLRVARGLSALALALLLASLLVRAVEDAPW